LDTKGFLRFVFWETEGSLWDVQEYWWFSAECLSEVLKALCDVDSIRICVEVFQL